MLIDYSVELKTEALVSLERLTQVEKNRIIRKIYWLATNFDSITPDYLTANLAGLFKLRVGNYRVVYSFSRELRIITIHIIGHRSEIYR